MGASHLIGTTRRAALLGLALLAFGAAPAAAGTVAGTVFEDFNANGTSDKAGGGTAADIGIGGITVTVTGPGGVLAGTATTAADGSYSIGNVTGPVRIEFTGLPSGYQSGPHGLTSGTSVQFLTVPDAGTSVADFGILQPAHYCQDNPLLALPCFRRGDDEGSVIEVFGLALTSDPDGNPAAAWTSAGGMDAGTRPRVGATNAEVGTVNGIAWSRSTKTLYSAAFLRRKARFGPAGTGGIYLTTGLPTATPATALFLDLQSVFPGSTGVDPHPYPPTTMADDVATRPLVGTRSFGDIELSADEKTLWVVNLNDRHLYGIPTIGVKDASTIARIPTPTPTSCPAADVRPFGLGRDDAGRIYLGATCSGQTGGAASLRAYVWRLDGSTLTVVLDEPLAGTRSTYPWGAWVNRDDLAAAPQPILGNIEFDRGAMIISLRDRYADQTPAAFKTPQQAPRPRGHGDTLRACPSGATFVFACTPPAGAFYVGDIAGSGTSPGTAEAGQGSSVQIAGFDLITTAYDPVNVDSAGQPFLDNRDGGGVQRLSNANGRLTGAYSAYTGFEPQRFQKSNGVGDLDALCDQAPVEIGNRVFIDADGNGVQGAGETGVDGVTVTLIGGDGSVVASTVTAGGGLYYFPVTAGATYTVRIDGGQPVLAPYGPTQANAGGDDTRDSDGIAGPAGSVEAAVGAHSPGQNDHSFDFGFFVPTYDLALTKVLAAGQASEVEKGSLARFSITVINQGSTPAKNVSVVDDVPAGLEFNGADNAAWTVVNGKPTTIVPGTIAPGGSATVDIALRVLATADGTIRNVAEISVDDGNDVDSTPDDVNTDTIGGDNVTDGTAGDEDDHDYAEIRLIVPVLPADIGLKKTANKKLVLQGGKVTFTLTVTSRGPGTAINVQVCDRLPEAMSFVSVPGGRIVFGDACWRLGNMPAGATRTLKAIVKVNAVARVGFHINTAVATADNTTQRFSKRKVNVKKAKTKGRKPGVTG